MSDAPTPEQIQETIAADVQAAREQFTLTDLFGGKQTILPSKTRLIFRDMNAAADYEQKNLAATQMRAMLDEGKPGKNAKAVEKKEYAEALKEVEAAEAVAAEARQVMIAKALVFHLRAYPGVAQKVVKREARNLFLDPATKDFREGTTQEEATEWMRERLFGEIVQKVTDTQGNVVEFGVPKAELGSYLSSNMHPLHWAQLQQDYDELTTRAGIVDMSLEDAGF